MTTKPMTGSKEPGSMLEVPGKGTVFFGDHVPPLKDEKERYVKTVAVEMGGNQLFTVNFTPKGLPTTMASSPKEIDEGGSRKAKSEDGPLEVAIHFNGDGDVKSLRFPAEHFEVHLCDGYDLYVFADYFGKVTGPAEDPEIRLSKLLLAEGEPVGAGEITEANAGFRYQECMAEVEEKIRYFHGLSPNAAFPDKWKDAPEGSAPRTWREALDRANDLRDLQEVLKALRQD